MVKNNVINHPFGNGLYRFISHIKMVKLGMVYEIVLPTSIMIMAVRMLI